MSALASAIESQRLSRTHACAGACAEVKVGDFGPAPGLARADGTNPNPGAQRLGGVCVHVSRLTT